MASVEAAITLSNVPEGEAAKARVGVINALSHAKLPPTKIHPQEAKAVKELAKDDDIVILPADKGRATVVMYRKDYSAKMLTMLGDRDNYQLMAKDPTTSLENRMNSVLLRLQREGPFLARPTTTFVALQLVSHVSMGCPRSTSLMSLSAQ